MSNPLAFYFVIPPLAAVHYVCVCVFVTSIMLHWVMCSNLSFRIQPSDEGVKSHGAFAL